VGHLLGVDLSLLNPAVPVALGCPSITVIGNNWNRSLIYTALKFIYHCEISGGTTVVCDPPPMEWGCGTDYFFDYFF
jgi:hypothetical protein